MEFKRFLAFVIDVFMSIIFFVLITVCSVLMKIDMHVDIIPWLVWGAIFCKDSFGGRSIGKRILGYQVIDNKTNLAARPFKCLIRNLTYILGIFDVAMMFYHSKGYRIGDYITHTHVEKVDKPLQKTKWFEAFMVIICVFVIIVFINMLLNYYASSLGLWGLLYK